MCTATNSPIIEGTTVFVVLDRRTRQLLYKGESADEVAELLEPGTCHGFGPTDEDALKMAMGIVEKLESQ